MTTPVIASRPARVSQPIRLLLASLAAVTVAFGFFVLSAAPAAAHDRLIASTPADGDVLDTAPAEIAMEMSAEPIAVGTQVVVLGPEGADHAGEIAISGTTVLTPLVDLTAGDYDVTWRVVSSDGHPISGEFHFTLTEAAIAPAPAETDAPDAPEDGAEDATAPGSGGDQSSDAAGGDAATSSAASDASDAASTEATAAASTEVTASADASAQASDDASDAGATDSSNPVGLIVTIVIAAVVVVALIVGWLVARRRSAAKAD